MTKFHLKFTLALLSVAIFITSLTVLFLPDQEISWGIDFYDYKIDYAKKIKEPKIAFAGASGTLYSLRSETFENLSGIKSVNLGVNGGFSFEFVIDRALEVLKSGDILFLVAEYPFFGSANLLKNDFHYYRLHDPKKLALFPAKTLIGHILSTNVIETLATSVVRGVRNLIAGPHLRPFGLNDHGDYLFASGGYQGNDRMMHYNKIDPESPFADHLAKTADLCRKRGIQFMVGFPAVLFQSGYDSLSFADTSRSIRAYYLALGLDVVGQPVDYFYDKSLVFNGRYHLSTAGAIKHTERIYQASRPYLARIIGLKNQQKGMAQDGS